MPHAAPPIPLKSSGGTKWASALLLALLATGASAQEYPRVIIPGDYADPSIMREGADYYLTHSAFYYAPGFLIWHSKDLVHWEPVTRAVPEYKGSGFAPDLLKYKGKYYLYYPADHTNWVVWADHIKGPWSKPIDLKISGIDPGHVADDQGHRYLYLNNGEVIELTPDGLATVGERKRVYDGWQYPKDWKTECMCLESPKLTYRNGYYYLTSAEGGTAGPATSHMVVAARSKSVLGPWENAPNNPIVHTYTAADRWWSKGHGTLIDDVNGNWWLVYHAYANSFHTLGRQTLLEPIEWTPDGWYRTRATNPPLQPAPLRGLELSDDFKGPRLGLQWTFWRDYAPRALRFGPQGLGVQGKGSAPATARQLLTTATDQSYDTQVAVTAAPASPAGLVLFYNEKAYAGVLSDGKQFTIYKNAQDSVVVPNTFGPRFVLKIENRRNKTTLLASKDGKAWTSLAERVDVSGLEHNTFHGFYALRIGLLAAGRGEAQFRQFRYRRVAGAGK